MDPLILTAELDADSFARYDAMRRAHFPDRGYRLPAHLTLFHQFPGDARGEIERELSLIAAGRAPMPLRFEALFAMGRGVAVSVEAPGLKALHRYLRDLWSAWLTDQDRGLRPHVTIQNKVSKEDAQVLLARLRPGFVPHDGLSTGLRLWHYRGGPWDEAARFAFSGAGSSR